MNDIFTYPYDSAEIMKRQKKLKKELLSDGSDRIKKKIAILCGSTVDAVRDILELFLLNYGIEPEFYTSEYGQFRNEALFPSDELLSFKPDIVYIHTTYRNINCLPDFSDDQSTILAKRGDFAHYFTEIWDSIREKLGCPIIQNNFELPPYRLLGNADLYDWHGRVHFVNMINDSFVGRASRSTDFYINDINYVSACFGLDEWYDNTQWYMYKYAMSMKAVPYLAANLAAIIKAIFGKNKKVLALDLDNTLWGGVVGDDGVEGIKIGKDLPSGQVYSEFQEYLKQNKNMGVLLTVCSKNEEENALAGLNHPDGILKPDDFIVIKANWDNKDENILNTAEQLNLLPESFVFADDNPAERRIVKERIKGAAVPEMDGAENYIRILDRNRYFEVVGKLSREDMQRSSMYKGEIQRQMIKTSASDYGEYLDRLSMKAEIAAFKPVYIQRIAQLTNKSNQFNLTTRRYTEAQMREAANDPNYITLYGRLKDIFSDEGVVSVVMGEIKGSELHILLWLMSCRVLKREMEYAMLDKLVEAAKEKGLEKLIGYYFPTAKNKMVKELYADFGFAKISEDGEGNTVWELSVSGYENRTKHIKFSEAKEA